MRDRTPTKVLDNGALRYGVYDESGNFLRHEYLALDDAPTDTGTDLSKATLLADETEVSLFGSAADRTVDDAFRGLAGQLKLIMGDMAQITVTLTDSAGAAIPGVLVQGILSDSGQAVYSDDSGVVSGYISEGSQTIKVTGYADIEDYSETLTVTKGTTITRTVTLSTRNFLKITSSQSVKFSGNVETVDVTVVGGGGSGGCGYRASSSSNKCIGGGGGGGGYCTVKEAVAFATNTSYSAVVGAGGSAYADRAYNGNAGGASSFLGVTANGGNGGSQGYQYDEDQSTSSLSSYGYGGAGNGKGGNGTNTGGYGGAYGNGASGSVAGYSSFTETTLYGGGGGGCDTYYFNTAGGSGAGYGGSAPKGNGQDGFGGGGCGTYSIGDTHYGKGGSGCVAIRMHLKSAA